MGTSEPLKRSSSLASSEEDVIEKLFQTSEYHLDVGASFTSNQGTTSRDPLGAINMWKNAAKGVKDYKKGEKETIRRVLDEIELISTKRMSEGFNEFNFSLGVFNCVSLCGFVVEGVVNGKTDSYMFIILFVHISYA